MPRVTTPSSGRGSPSGPAGAPSMKTGTVITSRRSAPAPVSSKRGFRIAATSAAALAGSSAAAPASAAERATGRPWASETTMSA